MPFVGEHGWRNYPLYSEPIVVQVFPLNPLKNGSAPKVLLPARATGAFQRPERARVGFPRRRAIFVSGWCWKDFSFNNKKSLTSFIFYYSNSYCKNKRNLERLKNIEKYLVLKIIRILNSKNQNFFKGKL